MAPTNLTASSMAPTIQHLTVDNDDNMKCVFPSDAVTNYSPFGKSRCISTESYGLVLLLLSTFIYSGMGCFIKLAVFQGLPSTELVFCRAVFQGFFVVIGLIVIRANTEAEGGSMVVGEGTDSCNLMSRRRRLLWTPLGGTSTVRKIVLIRGCIGGFGFVLYYYSIGALPLGDAIAMLSMYPIITVFFARIFLGENIRPAHLLAAFLSVTGAVLISRPTFIFGRSSNNNNDDQEHKAPPWFAYATAALGSCTGSAVFILIRKAGTIGAHTLQLLFSWVCFGLLFSITVGIFQGNWRLPSSATTWLYVLGACGVGTAAHFLLNYAGRLAPAGLASIMRSSGIMWAYMFEVLVFKQVPRESTIVGVALICISLVAVTLQKLHDERLAAEGEVIPEKLALEDPDEKEGGIELRSKENTQKEFDSLNSNASSIDDDQWNDDQWNDEAMVSR